jgi:hypothetical protein
VTNCATSYGAEFVAKGDVKPGRVRVLKKVDTNVRQTGVDMK